MNSARPPRRLHHIVQINDLSDPKGGASKLAVQAATDLAQRGHKVTFITGDAGDNHDLRQSGVEIVALGQKRMLAGGRAKAMITGLWNHAAYAMVRKWITAHDTPGTVYHVHGWAQILSPSLFAALHPVRDRLVISAHDFFLACPNGAFAWLKSGEVCSHTPLSRSCLTSACDRDGAVQKLWRIARHTILNQTFHPHRSPPILAIHASMGHFLERAGIPRTSIVTVPNPVEPFLNTRISAENNREILFVGRLEKTKGPDLVAQAAVLAGAALTVIGEGPMQSQIHQIHPNANLVGRRSPAEIRNYAKKARVLVMPSRYPEPFGLVAIEAAWSGLPIIISNTALLRDDIVSSGAGIGIDPRNTADFADAIGRIFRDDEATYKMSCAAFSNTKHLALTPSAWIDRLEDIFTERLTPRSDVLFFTESAA